MDVSYNHFQDTISYGSREFRIDSDGDLYEGRIFIEDDKLAARVMIAAARSIKENAEPASIRLAEAANSRFSVNIAKKVLKPMGIKSIS